MWVKCKMPGQQGVAAEVLVSMELLPLAQAQMQPAGAHWLVGERVMGWSVHACAVHVHALSCAYAVHVHVNALCRCMLV